MNVKKFLTVAMLVVLVGLVGGCHDGSSDRYRGYGAGSGSSAYREGYRDGRAAERQRETWTDSRYERPWWRRW